MEKVVVSFIRIIKFDYETFGQEKWYVNNISTIFLQQIVNDILLLVVIVRTKK